MDMAHDSDEIKKTDDLPATRKMLSLVRDELKSDISALQARMNSKFKSVDARFNSVDARFNSIDARFDSMDARFDTLESKIEGLAADVKVSNANTSRALALMEQVAHDSKVIMDGYTNLYARQDRVEKKTEDLEKLILDLKSSV
jgi:archaellum component FlaC